MVKEQRYISVADNHGEEVVAIRVWTAGDETIYISLDEIESNKYVWANMSIPEAKKVCLALRHFIDGVCDERQTD